MRTIFLSVILLSGCSVALDISVFPDDFNVTKEACEAHQGLNKLKLEYDIDSKKTEYTIVCNNGDIIKKTVTKDRYQKAK